MLPGVQHKLFGVQCGRLPDIQATQHTALPIEPPEYSQFPFETFADGLQDLRPRFFQRPRFRQDARDRVLRRELALGTFPGRNIPDERAENIGIAQPGGRNGDFDGKLMAVAVGSHHLDPSIEECALPGIQEMAQSALMRVPIAHRNHRLGHAAAERFLPLPPENIDRLRIPIRNDAARIHRNDGVQRRIDDDPVAFLTLQQRGLRRTRPFTFLLRLPMLFTQSTGGPEQQADHRKPDDDTGHAQFPHHGANRQKNEVTIHPQQDRPLQSGIVAIPLGLRITRDDRDVTANMHFFDVPRLAGPAQQHRW
jgi:hypothetical protein